jgi:hypothetical protein
MLPRVRVTEVLSDVEQATGFAGCFTHLRTGNPAADMPALLAAVLADGTNLGLSRMADATRGLSYHHLVNVAQWHISEDNYASARAAIVDAHHRHPLAAIWGDGSDSSSDGQYFRAGGRAGPGGAVNAKYGIDPGVVLYTTHSGQYGPMHTRVISATASEAPYVLDGLHPHAHRTSLRIVEHYTDTAGATVMWTSQGRDPQAASRSGWRCSGAARPRRASRGSGRPWRAPTPAYAARAGAGRKPGWSRSGSR